MILERAVLRRVKAAEARIRKLEEQLAEASAAAQRPPPGAQEMAAALIAWTTDDVDKQLSPAEDRLGCSITGPVLDWLKRIARGE